MRIFKSHEAIDVISELLPEKPIIIEAGAFTGHDTKRLAQKFPSGIIYAFEPVPELFKQLKERCTDFNNVICLPYALSNKTGTAQLHVAYKPEKNRITQASSLLAPKGRLEKSSITFPETIEVKTISLLDFIQEHKLIHIDLLWLDVQGYEFPIIKAVISFLNNIRAIYTEVGFIEAYEDQQQYEEIKNWLEKYNFVEIAKDFTNQTDRFFANVLFINQSFNKPSSLNT